jgi:hypothetical protein
MSTFILLSAIPGAGKSTWAKLYAKEHQGVHIVSSDDVRKAVTGNQQNFSQEPLVWKTFLDTINGFAKSEPSCTVIADSTNLNNKYRLYYRDMTPDFTHSNRPPRKSSAATTSITSSGQASSAKRLPTPIRRNPKKKGHRIIAVSLFFNSRIT